MAEQKLFERLAQLRSRLKYVAVGSRRVLADRCVFSDGAAGRQPGLAVASG